MASYEVTEEFSNVSGSIFLSAEVFLWKFYHADNDTYNVLVEAIVPRIQNLAEQSFTYIEDKVVGYVQKGNPLEEENHVGQRHGE